MADDVRPRAGDEQEVSSSGLLLSVDPLQGTEGYKLAGDDSDTSDILGGDSDGRDKGGDSDASDSDSGRDKGGSGDADSADESYVGGDSDGSDADSGEDSDAGEGVDSDSADAAMNPLGLGDSAGLDADASDSDGSDSVGPDSDATDAK